VNSLTLLGASVAITQPAAACTYVPGATQIHAPAAGVSGTISVTTSCPLIVSSDADWLTAVNVDSSVQYFVTANSGAARTATLTIGSVTLPVVQDGLPPGVKRARGQITSQ
jgi:hypothetical protein